MKQLKFFKNSRNEYGSDLLKKRKGRAGPRPLSTKDSMHLVLRSTKAKGAWSMRRGRNAELIHRILVKFANKYGIKILSAANAGNHLHIHMKLNNRFTYKKFIRAVTASIAMAITGVSRWKKLAIKFWDRRPFTRIIVGFKGFLTLWNYVRINQMEGDLGCTREEARMIVSRHALDFRSG